MSESFQKALWVAVPAFLGAVVTLFAGTRIELQVIAWGVLAIVAAFGWWTVNARKHRMEREDAEAKRQQEREEAEQKRWDDLNSRLDEINERLDMSEESDRAMLRSDLVRAHREWVEEKGYITLEALEVVSKTHEAYNRVHGNDTGDKLWEDIRALPIDEKR